MSHETFNLDELAQHLGRDKRELEKLVQRGRIPGRKVGSEWTFSQAEITQWLEQEMREFTEEELADLEAQQQSQELNSERPVSDILTAETMEVPLQARTKRSVLEALVEVAGRTWQIWEPATVLKAVQEREEVMPTAFECGVAIPHPRNPLPEAIGQPIVAYGRTFNPIPFGGFKGGMTDIFFLVLSRDARTHLHLLARLGQMIRIPDFADRLREADDVRSSLAIIQAADEDISLRGT
jgi:PTS system nitrogen regulatory IIA component